nr:MAG TPA: hypothetical protein [Caudoviricetes sp.]
MPAVFIAGEGVIIGFSGFFQGGQFFFFHQVGEHFRVFVPCGGVFHVVNAGLNVFFADGGAEYQASFFVPDVHVERAGVVFDDFVIVHCLVLSVLVFLMVSPGSLPPVNKINLEY